MIRGKMRNARVKPAPRHAAVAARVLVHMAVPAVAGLAITVAAAAVPADAAQQPHGWAAGHAPQPPPGGTR